jgi:hypothetical protein
MNAIHHDKGGRFLQPCQDGYREISDDTALKKIKQSIRDTKKKNVKRDDDNGGGEFCDAITADSNNGAATLNQSPEDIKIVALENTEPVDESPTKDSNNDHQTTRDQHAGASETNQRQYDLPGKNALAANDEDNCTAKRWSSHELEAAEQLYSLLTEPDETAPRFSAEDRKREEENTKERERTAAMKDLLGSSYDPVIRPEQQAIKRRRKLTTASLLAGMRREIGCLMSKKPILQQARVKAEDTREFSDARLELFLQREDMNPQVRFHCV